MEELKLIISDGITYSITDYTKYDAHKTSDTSIFGSIMNVSDKCVLGRLLGHGFIVCVKSQFLDDLDEQLPVMINDVYTKQQQLNRNSSIIYFTKTQLNSLRNENGKIEYHYYSVENKYTTHSNEAIPGFIRIAIADSPENCFIKITEFYDIIKAMNYMSINREYETFVHVIREYLNKQYLEKKNDLKNKERMNSYVRKKYNTKRKWRICGS